MRNIFHKNTGLLINCSVFVFFLTACSGPAGTNIKDEKKIEIDVSNSESLSIKDIFSSIELIPLSISSESVIKRVHKLVFSGGRYYILDDETLSLFVFDQEGQYLFKIHNVGNGPGEYSLLYDFNINRFTNNLELLNPRGSLLEFAPDGTYLGTLKIPVRASDNFVDLNRDTIVFYTGSGEYKLNFYSRSKGIVFKKDYQLPEKVNNIPMITRDFSPLNFAYDGSVIFFLGYNNASYNIVNDKVVERVMWDFGKHNFSLTDLPEEKSLEKKLRYLSNCYSVHSLRYYQENKKYIFMDFMYNKVWYSIVFDKGINDYKLIKKFKEDLFPPFNPILYEKEALFAADASEIQLFVNRNVLDETNRKIFESIRIGDNPVIIKYHLK